MTELGINATGLGAGAGAGACARTCAGAGALRTLRATGWCGCWLLKK